MPYFVIGLLAAAILYITNRDILLRRGRHRDDPATVSYRRYLMVVIAYHAFDFLWGVFDALRVAPLLYADTVLYFVAMACSIIYWVRYVVDYLHEGTVFEQRLVQVGNALFLFQVTALALNFLMPIVFWLDGSGVYQAGPARYINLMAQIAMFLLASVYALRRSSRATRPHRHRYLAIGLSGLSMALFISAQVAYPLLALYSVGCMISSCVIHSFVVEDEEDEYRLELEEALEREREQLQEIESARRTAYTDPLTGVKSKHAYVEAEEQLDVAISKGEQGPFGIAVFDLNNLKEVNDSQGHEAGDEYIVEACRLICVTFKHSPVYRIGGDEFVALLTDQDYRAREELVRSFDQHVMENLWEGSTVVASGMTVFEPEHDRSYQSVFERADAAMYQRKRALKAYLGRELRND